jgi:hypothetical protein
MVRIELPNVVPQKAYLYLTALIPGLFFELSVTLGNPTIIANCISDVQRVLHLGKYEGIGIVIFLHLSSEMHLCF